MFNRVKQFYKAVFPSTEKIDIIEMSRYLEKEEILLFKSMSDYDKVHSYNVFLDVANDKFIRDIKTYCRLALLHDIGKGKNINLMQRVIYTLFGIGKALKEHPKRGYEIMKAKDLKLAELILNHHNEDISSGDMKLFQKYDNRN